MRKVQKEIDVIATFRIGEPPEPHRFRIEDMYGERYEYRIGEIRDVRLCTYEEALALLPTDSRKAVLTAADHFLKEKADR